VRKKAEKLDRKNSELMTEILPHIVALPGCVEILAVLRERKIPHGIGTSSKRGDLKVPIKILGTPSISE
jgi:phosphoglycolate phosphatase-like HAD superfamily hydrolase